MNAKNQKINKKLRELGQTLGLDELTTLRAKRTTTQIVIMTVTTAIFVLLGNLVMPGGPVGLYYTGGSIKDFKILFGGFL